VTTGPILAVLLALAGCAALPQSTPEPLVLTFGDGSCSGTAIAPHAILTATHCLHGEKYTTVKSGRLIVKQRIDDGDDHTLLMVAQTFDASAQIAPMPEAGAVVHISDNPGDLRNLYAIGTVAGTYHGNTLVNLPIYFGDSGAAVVDSHGRIVGVISGVRVIADQGVSVSWGEVKPLRFTARQWAEAKL
jgi:V8-like Glu-specific endopeptidase